MANRVIEIWADSTVLKHLKTRVAQKFRWIEGFYLLRLIATLDEGGMQDVCSNQAQQAAAAAAALQGRAGMRDRVT